MSILGAADYREQWTGHSIGDVRDRWADAGPAEPVLRLCGETRIPRGQEGDVLEALRRARGDVQHLLRVIDRADAPDLPFLSRAQLSLYVVALREALQAAEFEVHARDMCVCHGEGNLVHSRIDI